MIQTDRLWQGIDAQNRPYALDLEYDDVTGMVSALVATIPTGGRLLVSVKDNVTGWAGSLTLALGTTRLVVPGGQVARTVPIQGHDPRLSYNIMVL